MDFESINYLAVVVGGLVPMVMGFIWYHPKLFGTVWMNSLGFKEEDLQGGNMAVIFGVSYLMSALIAYLLSTYIGTTHDASEQVFTHGAFHGAFLAVFSAIPVLVTNSLFEKRNWTNILINMAYWFITITLMGGVVSFFV